MGIEELHSVQEKLREYLGYSGCICYVIPCEYSPKTEEQLLSFARIANQFYMNTLVCIPSHLLGIAGRAETVCRNQNVDFCSVNFANGALRELTCLAIENQIMLFHAPESILSVGITAKELYIPWRSRVDFIPDNINPEQIAETLFQWYHEEIVGKIKEGSIVSYTSTMLHAVYQGHVQDVGWQNWVTGGMVAGTEGRSLRLEAMRLQLGNPPDGIRVKYRFYVSGTGWQEWVYDGAIAGTTGQSLPVEAIQIMFEGKLAADYSIRYKVHQQDTGWTDWVRDGEMAGVTGQSRRVEAVQIKVRVIIHEEYRDIL